MLQFGKTLNGNGNTLGNLKGVYTSIVEISNIEENSENNTDFNGKKYDLALIFSYKKEGLEFETKHYVNGNFAKSFNGWGSKLKVINDFITISEIYNTDKDTLEEWAKQLQLGVFPKSLKDKLIGKKFLMVEYVNRFDEENNKVRYRYWDNAFPVDADKAKIEEKFNKWVKYYQDAGYSCPYKPELLELVNPNAGDAKEDDIPENADDSFNPDEFAI